MRTLGEKPANRKAPGSLRQPVVSNARRSFRETLLKEIIFFFFDHFQPLNRSPCPSCRVSRSGSSSPPIKRSLAGICSWYSTRERSLCRKGEKFPAKGTRSRLRFYPVSFSPSFSGCFSPFSSVSVLIPPSGQLGEGVTSPGEEENGGN